MDPEHIKANTEIFGNYSDSPAAVGWGVTVFDFALTEQEVEELNSLNEGYRIVNPEKGPESWQED